MEVYLALGREDDKVPRDRREELVRRAHIEAPDRQIRYNWPRQSLNGCSIARLESTQQAENLAVHLRALLDRQPDPDAQNLSIALYACPAAAGRRSAAHGNHPINAGLFLLSVPVDRGVHVNESFFSELPCNSRCNYFQRRTSDNDLWYQRFRDDDPLAFVISPIGATDSRQRHRADLVLDAYIKPACGAARYRTTRGDLKADLHTDDSILASLQFDSTVIAYLGGGSVTGWNPNVMFEVGYRLATDLPVVLLVDADHAPLPFDVSNLRCVEIPSSDDPGETEIREVVARISESITEAAQMSRSFDLPYPEATILFDGDNPPVFQRDSTLAQQLFCTKRSLVNRRVPDVLRNMQPYFYHDQYQKFIQEQTSLVSQLLSHDHVAMATIPMVFAAHVEHRKATLAWLPIIIQKTRTKMAHRFSVRVLYLDVTHATEFRSGWFECSLGTDPAIRHEGLAEGGRMPRGPRVWDSYGWSYDRILPRLSFYCAVRDRHITALLEAANEGAPGDYRVLDIGAGTGNVAIRALEGASHVHAVDISSVMLSELRNKREALAPERRERLVVTECAIESLDGVFSETFDAVNILLTLFDVTEPELALDIAMKAAKPGGLLVITEPKKDFNLQLLLDQAVKELSALRNWDELREHWGVVEKANADLEPMVERHNRGPRLDIETIKRRLEQSGYQNIRMEDSHLGQCATVWARKPSA